MKGGSLRATVSWLNGQPTIDPNRRTHAPMMRHFTHYLLIYLANYQLPYIPHNNIIARVTPPKAWCMILRRE
jgi:hypothetical protein